MKNIALQAHSSALFDAMQVCLLLSPNYVTSDSKILSNTYIITYPLYLLQIDAVKSRCYFADIVYESSVCVCVCSTRLLPRNGSYYLKIEEISLTQHC